MRVLFILNVIFTLSSCGVILPDVLDRDDPVPYTPMDPTFQKYVDKFNAELKTNSVVPIVFGPMDPKFAGLCYKWTNGYAEVHIKRSFWEVATEEQREELIFHELGHCHLNRGHNDDRIIIGGYSCPESIMNSQVFHVGEIDNCYKVDYNHYITELGQ